MLEGKIAVVTGASSGIGRATAKMFVKNGSIVIGISRSLERLESVREELGDKFYPFELDVSDFDKCQEVVKEIHKRLGRIDVLVNNAGIARDTLFVRMSREQWDEVLNVNLNGVFNMTRAVIPIMIRQRGGSVINVSSVVGIYGNAGQTNYAASKAGIIGFSKALAKEVSKRGIRINVVAPGFIETPMTEKLSEDLKKRALEMIPLGRFGKPEDVAKVILFLASDLASYVNGTVLEVSGGLVF